MKDLVITVGDLKDGQLAQSRVVLQDGDMDLPLDDFCQRFVYPSVAPLLNSVKEKLRRAQ